MSLRALSREHVFTTGFSLDSSFRRAPFLFFLIGLLIAWGGFELLVVDNDTFVSKWSCVKLDFNVPRREGIGICFKKSPNNHPPSPNPFWQMNFHFKESLSMLLLHSYCIMS